MSRLLTREQEQAVSEAIKFAEKLSTGEIRVHIEASCEGDAFQRALEVFHFLGMTQTKARNGVLIFLAVQSKKFAVVGDKGIHQVVGKSFWNQVRDSMQEDFRNGKFAEGLICGIHEIGRQLKSHFPADDSDINELSDGVSFG